MKTKTKRIIQSSLIVVMSTLYMILSMSNLLHDMKVSGNIQSGGMITAYSLNSGDTKPDTLPPK